MLFRSAADPLEKMRNRSGLASIHGQVFGRYMAVGMRTVSAPSRRAASLATTYSSSLTQRVRSLPTGQAEGGRNVGPVETGSAHLQPPTVLLRGECQCLGVGGQLQGWRCQERGHGRCSPVVPTSPTRARLPSMFGGCCPWRLRVPAFQMESQAWRPGNPTK